MNPVDRVPSVEAASNCKFHFLRGSQIGKSLSNEIGSL